MSGGRDIDAATAADLFLDEERLEPEPPMSVERGIIVAMSRAEAIREGWLVDVTPIAASVGLRVPTAVTREAWASYAAVPPVRMREAAPDDDEAPASTLRPMKRAEGREARHVRRWRRQAERAAEAARGGRERRRVRVLLRTVVSAIRAAKAAGPSATLAITPTEIGPIAIDMSDRAAFSIGATNASGREVRLIAAATPGDEGETVITIMTPGDV